jgi:hypothetical protein
MILIGDAAVANVASPWWVDAEIYSLAYMQGMGVELAPPANTATEEAARAKEFFDTIERPGTKC